MTDCKYLPIFVDSVRSVFETMVQEPVRFDEPGRCRLEATFDISGIVGFSGEIVGTVALRMSEGVARKVVAKFSGLECEIDHPDFGDAVGELTNMIAGVAKAKLDRGAVSISTPSVILGAKHRMACPASATCVTLRCGSSCGEFAVDVAIRDCENASKAA